MILTFSNQSANQANQSFTTYTPRHQTPTNLRKSSLVNKTKLLQLSSLLYFCNQERMNSQTVLIKGIIFHEINYTRVLNQEIKYFANIIKIKVPINTSSKEFSPYDHSYVVICTLQSIDSIKLLKRTPQHIFVEVYLHVTAQNTANMTSKNLP
ncbi:hypothetical protein Avbf_17516 [Armadillidium vulgare]|nr:hypothetical protein Avbf_17516 [Armadillidium vulgare]